MYETKTEIIECECGTHLLKVESFIERIIPSRPEHSLTFYFAMFNYGSDPNKFSWWNRIKFCCKFLGSGKIYGDQLQLTPDEANKLAGFINENLSVFNQLKIK